VEYAELLALVETSKQAELGSLFRLAMEGGDEAKGIGLRARNLRLDQWAVWAGPDPGSLVEELEEGDWRCLVVDLGSLGSLEEQALTAEAVLGTLWRNRAAIGETFSFVPWSLLGQAVTLAQREALVAGKLFSHPAFARFGRRVSEQGGGDVPADWA
jgi:hypothetical protein